MAIIDFDLHTHTVYSHGKGTILQNAQKACELGLSALGIADHGPGHKGFGIKLAQVPSMRSDIEEAKKAYPQLQILLGVEANIINASGKLDLQEEDCALFDYLIAGYHYGVFGEQPLRACLVHAGGFFYRLGGTSTKAAKVFNTEMVINTLERNPVKIISHPGDKAAFDIAAIARCCEQTGTWMEINAHHKCLTVEGIRTAAEYGVTFVLGSDAHYPEHVAAVEAALQRADAAGLDRARIINLRRA